MKKSESPRALLPSILLLAGPTMLEQLLQTAVQYIDTAMVGALGTDATAAVGSTTTVNWLIGSTVSAIGVGFLAYISKAMGAGDSHRARRASAQAVTVTAIVGLIFTILTLSLAPFVPTWMQVAPHIRKSAAVYFFILYSPMLFRAATIILGTTLRSVGDTRTPMLVGIAVNITNVVLNFFLIYSTRKVTIFSHTVTIPGAGMGVIGAAVASAISFALGGILITVALFRHPDIRPEKHSFAPDPGILSSCMRVALPNALQRFGTSFGYVAFASMVNSLGDVATAAHTVANTVESLFYIPGYGMQTAAATLAGNAYGASDRDRLKATTKTILLLETFLMTLSGGLLFIFAPYLVTLFSKDAAVCALGTTVLRMVALSEPIFGFSIIMEGTLQGLGRTVMPLVSNIAGMWGIRIAGTAICVNLLGLGLESAWGCMILHNVALFLMFLVYYLSGKWNKI